MLVHNIALPAWQLIQFCAGLSCDTQWLFDCNEVVICMHVISEELLYVFFVTRHWHCLTYVRCFDLEGWNSFRSVICYFILYLYYVCFWILEVKEMKVACFYFFRWHSVTNSTKYFTYVLFSLQPLSLCRVTWPAFPLASWLWQQALWHQNWMLFIFSISRICGFLLHSTWPDIRSSGFCDYDTL